MEKLMQEDLDELDSRGFQVFKKAVVGSLKTRDVDHNEAFIKGALRSTLNGL